MLPHHLRWDDMLSGTPLNGTVIAGADPQSPERGVSATSGDGGALSAMTALVWAVKDKHG